VPGNWGYKMLELHASSPAGAGTLRGLDAMSEFRLRPAVLGR
jgi:hypothetical protein